MSCSRRWFALSLLSLVLFAPVPSYASPEAPQADFLTELLAAETPCKAQEQASLSEVPLLLPEPSPRVIYPDCGVFCSDSRCSGQRNGVSCVTVAGEPGWCKGQNTVCSNEPFRSPCFCTPF